MAFYTPFLHCWARSLTFLPLQLLATLGALFSSLTYPNLPCIHGFCLFSLILMSHSAPLALFQMLPETTLFSLPKCQCYVTNLANQHTLLYSQIPLLSICYGNNCPPGALDKFAFRGASFGHMIFSSNRTCFHFDVITDIDVSPPLLPVEE